jgi:hypothetical protein
MTMKKKKEMLEKTVIQKKKVQIIQTKIMKKGLVEQVVVLSIK